MKLLNPYFFGLLFLSVFAYLAYNSFQFPKFFFGETQETKGVVLDVRIRSLRHGFSQNVTYAFRHSDSLVIGDRRVKSKRGMKSVGTTFKLKYEPNDLTYFEIIHFYIPNFTYEEVKYIGRDSTGYTEVIFKNGILNKSDFKQGGELITTTYGEYKWQNDTLEVYELLSTFEKENVMMKFVEIPSKDEYFRLKDISTNGQTYFSLFLIKRD